MCYSPTLIKNPNYGRMDKLPYVVDTKSQYIPIPCGHCGECLRKKATDIAQRCQLEELFGYPFFITLTYNNESLVKYECSNGFKIAYAPVSDVQNMFKRLRKSGALTRRFRHLTVTELGSKKGRPHVHCLLFLQRFESDSVYTPFNLEKIVFKEILNEWRRNYGSTRKPVYRPLLTYVSRFRSGKLNSTYDCHYVTPSVLDGTSSDVSFYVSKYLCKDSLWRDKIKSGLFSHCDTQEEAIEVWSKIRPRMFSSLNFGFGIYDDINPRKVSSVVRKEILSSLPSADIVRSAVERSSKTEITARFYDLQTGKSIPLARYWYKFGDIYDLKHHEIFLSRQNRVDGVSLDERDFTSKLLSEQKFITNSKDSLPSNLDLIYG